MILILNLLQWYGVRGTGICEAILREFTTVKKVYSIYFNTLPI